MHRVVTSYTPVGEKGSNINVYVRVRPTEDSSDPSEILQIDSDDSRKVIIKDPDTSNRKYGEVSFQFDRVFWTETEQAEIFESTCKSQVDHVLNGYNSCCFAYGQTGSGKTYTMFGNEAEIRGIIPRSVEYLFQSLAKKSTSSEVAMVCSFLEIYNDQIRDLGKAYLVAMGVESSTSLALYEKTSDIFENLAGKRGNPYFAPAFHRPGSAMASSAEHRPDLKEVQDEYNTMNYEIREDNEGNVFVKDLSLVPVTTMEEVMSLITMGLRVRATHETKMNAVSSRSHTVFTITVLQRDKITGQAVTGMLNLVDLAGSERLKKSESQGIRLKEALHINTSLTALGKVIMALDPSSENTHVPYRDSKLTRVLQNSLGGNSFTSVIAAIHPSPKYYEECLSTLQFANRCRNVRNNPKVNYVDDGEDKDRKIKKLTEEIMQLRNKLGQQGQNSSSRGSGGENAFSASKLVAILKLLGINASVSADNGILVNGKKFGLDELVSSDNLLAESSSAEVSSKKDNNSQSVDKLQKTIKELKESSETYAMRAKERKQQVEEQTRELQKLSAELVKCRTVIKHKEFEYTSLIEEKERALMEQKLIMENKFKDEIDALMKSNEELAKVQQAEKEKIPQQLKQYTQLLQKFDKQVSLIEKPMKADFTAHLTHLEQSRVSEIDNLKRQYDYWLDEKDKALNGFVEAFNAYRAKKAEQLRMAEKEIVKLYEYTEQIEQILDNVEKGVYQVKQKQGTRGGRSTTGLMGTFNNTGDADGMGAVILPKGIRPLNPLKIPGLGHGLELTKKIVDKHKERVARLDKMKEEAFQKSLHLAAQNGATATGQIDDVLKQQVRDLLVAKSPKSTAKSSRRTSSSPSKPQTPSVLNSEDVARSRPATGAYESDRPQSFAEDETNAELEQLRRKAKFDQITTQRVLEDLASNETLLYIQKQDSEIERLRKQLKEVTNQLQSAKIANASLSRTVEKSKLWESKGNGVKEN